MIKYNKEKHKPLLIKGFKFLHSSLAAFIANLVVLTSCVELLNFPEPIAYALSVISATTASFFVCRYFVFKNCERESFFKQYWKFISSSMIFRVIEFIIFSIAVEFLNYYYLYAFVIIQGTATIVKFFFYKNFVFKDQHH